MNWRLITFVSSLTAMSSLFVFHAFAQTEADKARTERIEKLKNETIEESLSLLTRDGLSFYLDSFTLIDQSFPLTVPIDPLATQNDLTMVLANQRFRKVLAQVKNSDQKNCGILLSEALNEAKNLYDDLYQKRVFEHPELFKDDAGEISGALGAGTWSSPDQPPSIDGARIGLLSILILCAQIDPFPCPTLLLNIASESRDIRNHFYSKDSGNLPARVFAITGSSYSPILLGTALAASASANGYGGKNTYAFRKVTLASFERPYITPASQAEIDTGVSLQYLTSCNDADIDRLISALSSTIAKPER